MVLKGQGFNILLCNSGNICGFILHNNSGKNSKVLKKNNIFINQYFFKATLYPENKFNMDLVKKLIDKSYWPLYGEMKILDEMNDKKSCLLSNSCPHPSGVAFSYILLIIYMLVVNVLLLNLLIAMFR